MSADRRTLITAALPYANGPVHIGHLAGVYIPADIYNRYLKLKGHPSLFICGSDEHGVAITMRARKEGLSPRQVVDKYHELIKSSFADFGIAFDYYGRTSSQTHRETAQDFFRKLHADGKLIETVTEQFFDVKEQQFLADRYITGTCPKCGYENAYGDQCENCGSTLSPEELINPKSMLSGEPPVKKETAHWYLPLDKDEAWIRKWVLDDHPEWKRNVSGAVKSWLDSGLQPRAVTRDLDWGVPVPVNGGEGKVLYVWFDAPIGYISATKEHLPDDWQQWWQSDNSRLLHFIGKDNIVFHCIIFPAMLKAHGGYILPDNVPANEFLNLEGNKISTSRNWAVWLHEYLEDFKGYAQKNDALRYALTASMPESKDNDFTWKSYQLAVNSELVAILGNFVNRTLILIQKYYGGALPAWPENIEAADQILLEALAAGIQDTGKNLEVFRFREALSSMMEVARAGNKFLADTEPWKIQATDPERVAAILRLSYHICQKLASLMLPFLPEAAQSLAEMTATPTALAQSWSANLADPLSGKNVTSITLPKPQLLFEKMEDALIEGQIAKLEATKTANASAAKNPAAIKEATSFDAFQKMDIRVATILSAELVPKTKKLLKLSLDTGVDTRTVVSGIAEHFAPQDIIGKQVLLLANLAPREIKGILSQGMILMAEAQDGSLQFVSPAAPVWNGATVA